MGEKMCSRAHEWVNVCDIVITFYYYYYSRDLMSIFVGVCVGLRIREWWHRVQFYLFTARKVRKWPLENIETVWSGHFHPPESPDRWVTHETLGFHSLFVVCVARVLSGSKPTPRLAPSSPGEVIHVYRVFVYSTTAVASLVVQLWSRIWPF